MIDNEKKDDRLIEEGLQAIYGEGEVDFTTMERGRPRVTTILLTIVATLGVLAVLAWTGFFIFSRYFSTAEEETFLLEIETSEEVVSGEETTIFVNYKNPGSVPLASLNLHVKLPSSFEPTVLAPVPDDLLEMSWNVGSVGAGSDGSIAISGYWIANVPSKTPVQVFASYRPANFNADFSEIETAYISTVRSTLETEITGPEEARPGEELTYKVTVKNTGEHAMPNVIVDLVLPDGFFLEESEPKIEAGLPAQFAFTTVEPQEEKTITFFGSFAADREGFHYLQAKTSIDINDTRYTQQTSDAFTDVLRNDLSLQLVLNGTAEDVAVELGSTLRMTAAIQNTGDATISDADLLIDFQSELALPIVWGDAELSGGDITSAGVYWSATDVGAIAPGESKQFVLAFPIDTRVGTGQTDQFSVLAESTTDALTIRSTPITVLVSTEAVFTAEIRYFDDAGVPLGTGPLPPVVGGETEYRLFWRVENSLHDLENVTVTANLPPGVEWVGVSDVDLGTISYNNTTRLIEWKLNNLPKTVTILEATAALRLTPEEDDLGTFVKLISGSTFKATDVVTQASIERNSESLDTDLETDEFADGKGAVVEVVE